jgi:hypothetical protein
MNDLKNAIADENELDDLQLDFEELENQLEASLEQELADLEQLKVDHDKIANPEALGEVIENEIWNQFANQIGLDMTNETLIQKYDREHPETYEEVGKKVMQDERYKSANKEMKQQQAENNLKDEYTGKDIKSGDKANLDHTVSRKELYENKRRRQANIATEDLANKKENLNATNESLNKSKGAKSVDEMIATRAEREKALIEQNERANKKIDESNMSETEKRLAKEKNNKRLQDKLDADDELMKKKDTQARKAINKDIAKGVVKETGKKAGKDALKMMAVQALAQFLKEVMNALIRFFKSSAKTFKGFLAEMKIALHNFISKLSSFMRTGVTTAVGTIVSEIFGPIVSIFKKLASVIKQGFRSLGDAIAYLKDKKHKDDPFSVRVAQVGKIVVSGLVAAGAIFGGELFEMALESAFPPLKAIQFGPLGSLANIIGLFLASLISGIVGAIILNYIDKIIAKEMKRENVLQQLEKGNSVLNTQRQLVEVQEAHLYSKKNEVLEDINENHKAAGEELKKSLNTISNNMGTDKQEDLLNLIKSELEK